MTSLERPSSARRTILARITSQYGDVYLRAIEFQRLPFFAVKSHSGRAFSRHRRRNTLSDTSVSNHHQIGCQKYVIVFPNTSTKAAAKGAGDAIKDIRNFSILTTVTSAEMGVGGNSGSHGTEKLELIIG